MRHPLNAHRAIDHAEENHIAAQCCHPQAGSQVLAACIAQWGMANALALLHQLADKTPGVGPAVLGDVIANVEEVLPRFRREGDRSHQAVRLPLGLVVSSVVGSA